MKRKILIIAFFLVLIIILVAYLLWKTLMCIFFYIDQNTWQGVTLFVSIVLTSLLMISTLFNKIFEMYSDYLDYSDIEDIKSLININFKQNKKVIKEYLIMELWYQINRRAEKAKIASMRSLDSRFSNLKEWIMSALGALKK